MISFVGSTLCSQAWSLRTPDSSLCEVLEGMRLGPCGVLVGCKFPAAPERTCNLESPTPFRFPNQLLNGAVYKRAIGVLICSWRGQFPRSTTCSHRTPSRANGRVAQAGRNQWCGGAPGRIAVARRRTGLSTAGSRVQRARGALRTSPLESQPVSVPTLGGSRQLQVTLAQQLQDSAPRSDATRV